MPDKGINPETLANLLECNVLTGSLFWKKREPDLFPSQWAAEMWNAKHAEKEAFTALTSSGYRCGRIFGKMFVAHRVVWCLANQAWPKGEIDHINGDRTDNRIANLRVVNKAENAKNMRPKASNTSGVPGVYWLKNCSKWRAFIYCDYKKIHLGLFDDFEEACDARKKAEQKHGFHKNHGLSLEEIRNA